MNYPKWNFSMSCRLGLVVVLTTKGQLLKLDCPLPQFCLSFIRLSSSSPNPSSAPHPHCLIQSPPQMSSKFDTSCRQLRSSKAINAYPITHLPLPSKPGAPTLISDRAYMTPGGTLYPKSALFVHKSSQARYYERPFATNHAQGPGGNSIPPRGTG